MELNENDESTSIFFAPQDTVNFQRKQENIKDRIFKTSDMNYKSKMIIGNNLKKMMKTEKMVETDNNVIDYDSNICYASTSSTSCSLHDANDATKPSREFFTPINKEALHTNLNKCTSETTRDIEMIAYLERERSMDIRDTANYEKYNYDSNKRLSLLPNHFRRESGASNSSTRYLISNNNPPVLIPPTIPSKDSLECSYSSARSDIILENITLHTNTIDNDLIEECRFENLSANVWNNSIKYNRHCKARSKYHAENHKFTKI